MGLNGGEAGSSSGSVLLGAGIAAAPKEVPLVCTYTLQLYKQVHCSLEKDTRTKIRLKDAFFFLNDR